MTGQHDDDADGRPSRASDGAPIEVHSDGTQWHIRRDGILLGTFPTRAAAETSAAKVATELGVSTTTT